MAYWGRGNRPRTDISLPKRILSVIGIKECQYKTRIFSYKKLLLDRKQQKIKNYLLNRKGNQTKQAFKSETVSNWRGQQIQQTSTWRQLTQERQERVQEGLGWCQASVIMFQDKVKEWEFYIFAVVFNLIYILIGWILA